MTLSLFDRVVCDQCFSRQPHQEETCAGLSGFHLACNICGRSCGPGQEGRIHQPSERGFLRLKEMIEAERKAVDVVFTTEDE